MKFGLKFSAVLLISFLLSLFSQPVYAKNEQPNAWVQEEYEVIGPTNVFDSVGRSIYTGFGCWGPCDISRTVSTTGSHTWSSSLSVSVSVVSANTGIDFSQSFSVSNGVSFAVPTGEHKGIWYYDFYHSKYWTIKKHTYNCSILGCSLVASDEGVLHTKEWYATSYYLDWVP